MNREETSLATGAVDTMDRDPPLSPEEMQEKHFHPVTFKEKKLAKEAAELATGLSVEQKLYAKTDLEEWEQARGFGPINYLEAEKAPTVDGEKLTERENDVRRVFMREIGLDENPGSGFEKKEELATMRERLSQQSPNTERERELRRGLTLFREDKINDDEFKSIVRKYDVHQMNWEAGKSTPVFYKTHFDDGHDDDFTPNRRGE